jgi:hypothetical protein
VRISNIKNSFEDLDDEERLIFYSHLLSTVGDKPEITIILNSSQQVEAQLITNYNKYYLPLFYDFYEHQGTWTNNLHIAYCKNFHTEEYQIQLYSNMWFEIEAMLRIK